ncbi:hypothetical protein FACS189451_05560 [Bacteroidia bacterium]|nr:hypothetical protein FACS189446_1420 [Bacteroidia bacterium]GHT62081.1 hypothetical protein FACS189451_05560 [Bacteroidia bacterium]
MNMKGLKQQNDMTTVPKIFFIAVTVVFSMLILTKLYEFGYKYASEKCRIEKIKKIEKNCI